MMRRTWLMAAGLVVTVGAVGATLLLRGEKAVSTPPPTVAVQRGDVTYSVAASGTVQPVATRELAFSTSGTITSVSVKAGDQVRVGQTLATIDPADAQETVDKAEDVLADAESTLDAAEAASPAPGKDNVYSAEIAVSKAEQELAAAKRVLTGTKIVAPVAGKVLSVGGKVGDSATSKAFIKVGVVSSMLVKAEFAEADATTLKVGQQATVQLGNQPGKDFAATIDQVAAAGTITDKLVRYTVMLKFDSPPADLLIGQSATAEVVLNRAASVLYLPASAVSSTGIVKLPDGQSAKVQVGLRGDGNVEVTDGLAEGSLVLLNVR